MEKLTVLQLSKRTGLSRTQIYYLQTKNKLKIINGKINFNEALPAIIELLDKKSNKDSEVNFKQILNLLISQNISLQTQLNLAHEREKAYLTELASYRQNLAQETTPQPSTDESNTQAELENNGVHTDENALNKMEAESETQTPTESCQSINKEMTEQNDEALIGISLPNQDDMKPLLQLNRHKKSSLIVTKGAPAKCINLVENTNKRKPRNSQPVTDQEELNIEGHHD